MKAVVQDRYGPPEVLQLQEVDKPVPDDNQVLVRVRAASLNALDWHLMRGKPFLARFLGGGLGRPKHRVRGVDLAGSVEGFGKKITRWKSGDEVFGTAIGAFAEYAVAPEGNLVRKPSNLSFEQAAAVPIAAFTALEAIRDKARVKPGQRVLIYGAGGGVGTFAIQLAKHFGARITAVTQTPNLEMALSLGANEVVDYTKQDFVKGGQRYDVFLDISVNRSLADCRRVLAPDGAYVMVGSPEGGTLSIFGRILKLRFLSAFGRQRLVSFVARGEDKDLVLLKELLDSGKLLPVIDRRYPLSAVVEAFRYLETHQARGKVVISVS